MTIFTYIWTGALNVAPFLFVLSLVVVFHEMEHFLAGRWCGVKVDAFSLGFGPELFAFADRRDTRWRVGALPLGGYVKFHGDANAASMTDAGTAAAMSPADRAVSFFSQKVCKRAAIVTAGPIANFILAVMIFTGIDFINGLPIQSALIRDVEIGSATAAAGFLPGDLVVSIDGTKIDSSEDLTQIVQTASERYLTFVIDRQGRAIELAATPRHHHSVRSVKGRPSLRCGVERSRELEHRASALH